VIFKPLTREISLPKPFPFIGLAKGYLKVEALSELLKQWQAVWSDCVV
jgi:hypothetical protein